MAEIFKCHERNSVVYYCLHSSFTLTCAGMQLRCLSFATRLKMMQGDARPRRLGAHDFLQYYDFVCARQESVPLPAVKMNLDKGMLDLNGDRVEFEDWLPILSSISINKTLRCITISSTFHALSSRDTGKAEHKPFSLTMSKKAVSYSIHYALQILRLTILLMSISYITIHFRQKIL